MYFLFLCRHLGIIIFNIYKIKRKYKGRLKKTCNIFFAIIIIGRYLVVVNNV